MVSRTSINGFISNFTRTCENTKDLRGTLLPVRKKTREPLTNFYLKNLNSNLEHLMK